LKSGKGFEEDRGLAEDAVCGTSQRPILNGEKAQLVIRVYQILEETNAWVPKRTFLLYIFENIVARDRGSQRHRGFLALDVEFSK